MTKILLLSDTHGYIDDLILKHVLWADEVWHAGDIGDLMVTEKIAALKKLRAVFGNIDDNDTRMRFPQDAFFEIENKKIWMTHIGGYPGKYASKVTPILKSKKIDLFICGHSHILKIIYDQKFQLLHLNPGAAGIYGFHSVRTMLRFIIDEGEIKNMEIIEIEK